LDPQQRITAKNAYKHPYFACIPISEKAKLPIKNYHEQKLNYLKK